MSIAWFRSAVVVGAMLFAPFAQAALPPVLAVDSGKISGEATAGLEIFRGIPYAAPPVGPLRWRPPQPAISWKGTRDAAKFGPSCPQATGEFTNILKYGGAAEPTSEDCLTLNVWKPASAAKNAPVMVWIHGGAGRLGAGSLPYYDGTSFARDGVVLVTFNYRLGHLGSFAYPGLSAEAAKNKEPVGNYAEMDQIAALKWVKRNIAMFGGDPNNVTIFGESSGGVSVFNLLATPSARGLFQKAIVESGGGWFPPPPTRAAAEKRGEEIAKAAGAAPGATLAQLRALPAQTVAHVPGDSASEPDPGLAPDGITVAIASGEVTPVPLMISINDGEQSLINRTIAQAAAKIDDDTLAKLRNLYGENLDRETAAGYQFRDQVGTAAARWVSAHWPAPAYLCRFEHVSESYRPVRKRALHGAEIFYVFETLGREPDMASHPTPADEALAAQIHARWVAFAKSGSPNAPGLAHWPAYSAASDPWMVFGQDHTSVQPHLMKAQLDYYESKTTPLIFYFRVRAAIVDWFSYLTSWA